MQYPLLILKFGTLLTTTAHTQQTNKKNETEKIIKPPGNHFSRAIVAPDNNITSPAQDFHRRVVV
jgi:hypothetical protein